MKIEKPVRYSFPFYFKSGWIYKGIKRRMNEPATGKNKKVWTSSPPSVFVFYGYKKTLS